MVGGHVPLAPLPVPFLEARPARDAESRVGFEGLEHTREVVVLERDVRVDLDHDVAYPPARVPRRR